MRFQIVCECEWECECVCAFANQTYHISLNFRRATTDETKYGWWIFDKNEYIFSLIWCVIKRFLEGEHIAPSRQTIPHVLVALCIILFFFVVVAPIHFCHAMGNVSAETTNRKKIRQHFVIVICVARTRFRFGNVLFFLFSAGETHTHTHFHLNSIMSVGWLSTLFFFRSSINSLPSFTIVVRQSSKWVRPPRKMRSKRLNYNTWPYNVYAVLEI